MSRINSPEQIKRPNEEENFLIETSSSKLSKLKEKTSENKGSDSVRKIIELKRVNNNKNQEKSKIKPESAIKTINITSKEINENEQYPEKKSLMYQYQMLRKIPTEISIEYKTAAEKNRVKLESVEQIIMFTNYLLEFSDLAFEKLIFLKELDLSENLISEIPVSSINENLINLETLKLNFNQIEILPYLKHVKNLQMLQNPLQKITKNLVLMNLEELQIDWLDYLQVIHSSNLLYSEGQSDLYLKNSHKKSKLNPVNIPTTVTSVSVLNYEYLKKLNEKYGHSHEYYDFQTLFKLKAEKIRSECFEDVIAELLLNALEKEHTFFIEYLIKFFPELHYNKMTICSNLILEDAIQVKNSQLSRLVMQLFMPKKWPYDYSFPFIDNLLISIKYQSVIFFTYLVELSCATEILLQEKHRIFQFLPLEYKETAESDFITNILCEKIFSNKLNKNSKLKSETFQLDLSKYSLLKSKSIMSFWNFIARNEKLNKLITLVPRSSYCENSILHFGIRSPCVEETLNLILHSTNQNQIFEKNTLGQLPRSQFSATRIFKKVLWKLEQEFFKEYFVEKTKPPIENMPTSQEHDNFKKPHISYIKLSGFRTKSIKDIIKLLEIKCAEIKIIFENCKLSEFTEKEQSFAFFLHHLMKRFSLIQNQLRTENNKLSTYEIQMIIFKLLQTQIFDKRSYLAGEIGKILLPKEKEKSKEVIDKNENKENCSVGFEHESDSSDDKLLTEYELFQSILFFKTENFMVSSSLLQNEEQKTSPEIGMFDLSRFGCQKCE